jgi:hypothetical protein
MHHSVEIKEEIKLLKIYACRSPFHATHTAQRGHCSRCVEGPGNRLFAPITRSLGHVNVISPAR